MNGFDFKLFQKNLSSKDNHHNKIADKEYWKHFRDLIHPKWHNAFIKRIKLENPKVKKIKYIILCVYAKNKSSVKGWIDIEIIKENFRTTEIELVSIESKEITELISDIKTKDADFAENSDFVRTLQLLRAAKVIKNHDV